MPARLRKALEPDRAEPDGDPDFMIYSGGFFSDGDRTLMDVVRESTPEQLAMLNLPFRDRRLPEMLFRYRARNFPETLGVDELARWEHARLGRLRQPPDDRLLGLKQFRQELAQAREDTRGDHRAHAILDQVEAWSLEIGLD